MVCDTTPPSEGLVDAAVVVSSWVMDSLSNHTWVLRSITFDLLCDLVCLYRTCTCNMLHNRLLSVSKYSVTSVQWDRQCCSFVNPIHVTTSCYSAYMLSVYNVIDIDIITVVKWLDWSNCTADGMVMSSICCCDTGLGMKMVLHRRIPHNHK